MMGIGDPNLSWQPKRRGVAKLDEHAQGNGHTHNEHFVELMDVHMPDWRARCDGLNGVPLTEEEWISCD